VRKTLRNPRAHSWLHDLGPSRAEFTGGLQVTRRREPVRGLPVVVVLVLGGWDGAVRERFHAPGWLSHVVWRAIGRRFD
jgi:hypothetical protein